MACSLNVHPVDSTEIPFITEADEDSIIPTFPNSRKYSFQDETIKKISSDYSANKRRISSLEELRLFNDHLIPEVVVREKRARRHSSQLRRKGSSYENYRRSSIVSAANRQSRQGSRRYSHSSGEYERRKSISQSRRNSSMRSAKSLQHTAMTPKQIEKEKRRRRIVFAVVATFLFILVCSVLAVVVTLTHQSEFTVENKTLTYYTFAPDAKIAILKSELNNERYVIQQQNFKMDCIEVKRFLGTRQRRCYTN